MKPAGDPQLPNCAANGPLSFATFALARAHRGFPAEQLRELGLHPGQELLLMQLLDRDGQTQSDLLDSVGLDHSTVSKSLTRMQGAGLVTRVADKDDKRAWRVWLTRKGRAMRPRIVAIRTTLEHVSAAGVDAAFIGAFIHLSQTIQQSIADGDRVTSEGARP
jgi:DNA-binding MarR family transcriptional regulator